MIKDFVSDLKTGRISRREANRKLATLGLGLVTLPMMQRRAAAADNDMIYFTWEGYEIPEFQAEYMAKYGAVAPNAIFASEEEALQKLRAGFEATLAHPCTYSLTRWKDAGVIQPLDTSRLKHYPDLYEGLRTLPGAQMDGKTWFVPFDWGNSSVVYRTDMTEGMEESWGMLYDERLAGKIGMSSDAETNVEVAALVLGHKNIFALSDEQLAQVKPLMVKQKNLLRFYWDSQTTMEQAMAAGEVAAAYAWNSSYTNLKNQGIPVAFANPKEGIFTWCCGLTLLNPAIGNVDAAYDLIDAMIAPESGKYLIEAYSYGHSNKKAFEIADPVAIDALGMRNPDELFSTGIFFEPLPDEYSVKYVEMFTEIQAG